MNFYPWHIGDFMRDTSHLSMLEECAYRRLLDYYYATERPLPLNLAEICRIVRAQRAHEKNAVAATVKMFFVRSKSGYRNKRADQEIAKFKAKSDKAAKAASVRWDANAMRTHSERNAIPEPEPKPRTKRETKNPPISVSVPDNTHSVSGPATSEVCVILQKLEPEKPKSKDTMPMPAPTQLPQPARPKETQEQRRDRALKAIAGLPDFSDDDLARTARVTREEIAAARSASSAASP